MKNKRILFSYKLLASTLSEMGFSWKGLRNNKNGEWWLIAQITVISAHLADSWPYDLNNELYSWLVVIRVFGKLLVLFGTILALGSVLRLGKNLSPLPEPKRNAKLVMNGIYSICRHPLYMSMILISIGLNLIKLSLLHLILLISLCFILTGKAIKEEHRLKGRYPEYSNYMKETPAIFDNIPFFDWRD
ncbi:MULTISPECIES: methyltransferase family protein [Prochlorococcus]|uniref:methyltransferase family protein n=1 Tax=Prochlorococcus TaxID=1218 RepID=UPI000533A80F|nr:MULTISPECIES: isoprenylcysteine carboxylmethyltransferase family protein [Prochlorococcus]KGG12266.1 hypothetical protein EV05_1476 [Prochlorococcus sp. MIT 0601]